MADPFPEDEGLTVRNLSQYILSLIQVIEQYQADKDALINLINPPTEETNTDDL